MAIGPSNTVVAVQRVAAAVAAGDLSGASTAATEALRNGLRHPALFNARALWLQEQGRLPEALAEFQQALMLTPNDVRLLNAIGLACVRCNRVSDGIAAFESAIALVPNDPVIHFRKGWALASGGDQEGARRAYERAIEIKPEYAEALAAIASIAARNGEADTARDFAERCRNIDPTEPTAIIALAIVENNAGNFETSEALLRQALSDPRAVGHTKGVLLGFLGDALDGQGRTSEAFAAYAEKAETFRRLHGARMAGVPAPSEVMKSLAGYLEVSPAEKWRHATMPEPVQRGPREHVFLLGFLRSGTTLLEQVLDTHPDVVSLEERDSFGDLSRQFMAVPAGLDKLVELSGAALDDARAAYWQRVRQFGTEPDGKVFIDKQPLNTIHLPLIAKLFPEAKILFALRDPRDVVFSCYRRHFEVNPTMFAFLDLTEGAEFYASVMNVAAICREKLPLTLHEHRYEEMVENFDASVRAVCEFLGLEWTDAMRGFSDKARDRAIRSPSAAQVRRPLYGEGVAQWRAYEEQLRPILPVLAPWVEKFGYPAG